MHQEEKCNSERSSVDVLTSVGGVALFLIFTSWHLEFLGKTLPDPQQGREKRRVQGGYGMISVVIEVLQNGRKEPGSGYEISQPEEAKFRGLTLYWRQPGARGPAMT